MSRLSRAAGIAGAVLIAATSVGGVLASSHREAPLIATDPSADSTDLYAFVDPADPSRVNLIANYIPMQDPAGGPNFWAFDPNVRYAIHVDNNGDGKSDVSYWFRFKTTVKNGGTFLYNTGQVTTIADPDQNVRQTYSVTKTRGDHARNLGSRIPVAPANVGPRSDPDYAAVANGAVTRLTGGGWAFAGQRDDPFFVDLGSIFDLGGLRPFNAFHLIPGDAAPGIDDLKGLNVHSIAINVPITSLTRDGKTHAANDPKATIGVWTAAYRQRTTVRTSNGGVESSGKWVQISRLGNPLINEVIIPLAKKDYWNSQPPSKDKQFTKYYEKPELAGLVNLLYPALPDAGTTGRTDLSLILLHGVPTVNNTGKVAADLLRLNTGIAPCTADDPTDQTGACRSIGVFFNGTDAAPDLQAWPNGRRLGDDVVDMEIRAVAQGYGPILNSLFGLPNLSPNNIVGDGVDANDHAFLSAFPYVALPNQGYSHTHHAPGMLPL
ncbi:MAG: DUF4331 domain-containing protein [Candidatus Limnocylindrales bacterium]